MKDLIATTCCGTDLSLGVPNPEEVLVGVSTSYAAFRVVPS